MTKLAYTAIKLDDSNTLEILLHRLFIKELMTKNLISATQAY